MGYNHEFYYRMAIFSASLSIFSVLFLTVAVPTLYLKSSNEMLTIETKAQQFKEDSNRIWREVQVLMSTNNYNNGASPTFFSRKRRNPWDQMQTCQGMPASYCPSDCGVSHIVVPVYQTKKESEDSDGYRKFWMNRK
uniref:Col_cuticle_N domain-containing protein n=1 Tax=Heterorhabditis bacteriophora TaxID=37862 RepID=A0A1I7WSK8_HETBA